MYICCELIRTISVGHICDGDPVEMAGTTIAIDLGKFGTAFSWSSDGNLNPCVGNLDRQEPEEDVHRKSPNSLLVLTELTEAGTDGNWKPWFGDASFGETAETRYGEAGAMPVGAQLFRRFGFFQSWRLNLGPHERVPVKSSSNDVHEMEVEALLVMLLKHVKDVSTCRMLGMKACRASCKGHTRLRQRVVQALFGVRSTSWSRKASL